MACVTTTTIDEARHHSRMRWGLEDERRLRAELLARGARTRREVVARWLADLDATEPFGDARDELVAVWLRLWRRDHDALALAVALCAMVPRLERLFGRAVRGRRAPRDEADLRAALWYAAVQRLCAFDPDARSVHILRGVELDVWSELCEMWRGALRAREAHAHALVVAHGSRDALAHGEVSLHDLLERPEGEAGDRRARFDADEVEHARRYLDALVAAKVLDARGAVLLLRCRVERRAAVDVAAELKISEAAARKATQRAVKAVMAHHARTLRDDARIVVRRR